MLKSLIAGLLALLATIGFHAATAPSPQLSYSRNVHSSAQLAASAAATTETPSTTTPYFQDLSSLGNASTTGAANNERPQNTTNTSSETQPSSNSIIPASLQLAAVDPLTDYVTQGDLASVTAALDAKFASEIAALTAAPSPSSLSQNIAAGGNGTTPFVAASLPIGQLSNVTISNPTITGTLSASNIPAINLASAVSGTLPVSSGGTGWTNINSGSILFGNGSSALATSSNLYWDNTDGRLGIGTTTPATALEVVGALTLENNDYDNLPTNVLIDDGNGGGGSLCDGNGTSESVIIGGGSPSNQIGLCNPDVSVVIGHGASSYGTGNNWDQIVIGFDASVQSGNSHDTLIGAQGTIASNGVSEGGSAETILGAASDIYGGNYADVLGYAAVASSTGGYDIALGAATRVYGSNSANIGDYNNVVSNNNTFVYGSGSTFNGFGTVSPQNRLDVAGAAAIGSYAGISTAPANGLIVSGSVGVGTTSPSARLTIWGPDTASTTAFNVVNSASTTVFAVYDSGNSTYSGSIFQSSDQRLKTNVQPLDASSSLSLLEQLNPVSYLRIDQPGTGENLGFLAQQVEGIFPELVSTTSPTALTPDGTLTLNYTGLIAPIVSAIQDLANEISSLESTIAGFAENFVSQQITATRTLCVDNSQGIAVCITGDQLAALLSAAGSSDSPISVTSSGTSSVQNSSPSSNATDTPPVFQINGDNPANVDVGAVYNDLGATITGPEADLDLGIDASVDGGATTTSDQITIDTSQPGTHAVLYCATDQSGLTTCATRTVNIIAPADGSAATSSAATSTSATSTPSN